MGRACVLLLAAAAVAVGAVPTSHRAASVFALRGPPASSGPSLAALTAHLSETPSLLQVSEHIRSGAPGAQIIELLRTVKDDVDAAQLEDDAKQTEIQKGCAKEVADAKNFVDSIQSEINGVSIHKDTLVSDTDLESKKLQIHDDKARKAQVEKNDAELHVRDLQTRLMDVVQVIQFTQKKEEPRLLRLAAMVDKVESMKVLIQEAIGKNAGPTSANRNEAQPADADTDKDTTRAASNASATLSNTTAAATPENSRSNATGAAATAAAVAPANATVFLEMEGRRTTGGARSGAQQMADAAATQALRALALQIMGAHAAPVATSEAAVPIDANAWVESLLGRMDALKTSFSDQLSSAKTALAVIQERNVAREADIKKKLADGQEKLKALMTFLDKEAGSKVGTSKAAIERLGSQVADATVSLERSNSRLKDAQTALKESENTCKTYAEQYADRKAGRKQEARLAGHLLEVIMHRLEDIRHLLQKAQGGLTPQR